MEEAKEVSGLDMLKDLVQEVGLLRKEMRVLDQNIKKIANSAKISELATKAMGTPLEGWARSGGAQVQASAAPSASPGVAAVSKSVQSKDMRFGFDRSADPAKPQPPPVTACMCQGKMVAELKGSSIPLPDLDVKIFDEVDAVVKTTKTNRAGVWMSQLKPGNYVANIEGKYAGKDLYPINLAFMVKKGMKKLEVK